MLNKVIRKFKNNNKMKQKKFRNKLQNKKMNFKKIKINFDNFSLYCKKNTIIQIKYKKNYKYIKFKTMK